MRTDSPTCDIEGLNILLSWVSCERLTVKSGDITNAYFQGCPLERLILMRQPPGGVPDVDISADTMFVAHVPIYGTCDAGRGFWKKLRHDILSTGLKENAVIRALYIYQAERRRQQTHQPHARGWRSATESPCTLWHTDGSQQGHPRYTSASTEGGRGWPETQSTRHHHNDKTKVITPRLGYQQFPSSLHYLLSPLPCSLPHDHRRDTPETPKPQTTTPKSQACDLILIFTIRLLSSFRLFW